MVYGLCLIYLLAVSIKMALMDEISKSENLTFAASWILIALHVLCPLMSLHKRSRKTEDPYFNLVIGCWVYNSISVTYLCSLQASGMDITQFGYRYFTLSNLVGMLVGQLYMACLFKYWPDDMPKVITVFMPIYTSGLVLTMTIIYKVEGVEMNLFLGLAGILAAMVMYASPLFAMVNYRKTGVSTLFLFGLSSAFLLSNIAWVVAENSKSTHDFYIFNTNVIGALLSFLQLLAILIMKFGLEFSKTSHVHNAMKSKQKDKSKKTKKNKKNKDKKEE